MKTYRTTLNRYFFSCAIALAATVLALFLEALAPLRDSASSALGLASNQLWLLATPILFAVLLLLSIRLKKQLAAPIQTLSEECALGKVPSPNPQPQLRETRIIRNFLCQTQERANSRATQISKMEAELFAIRKKGDRKVRRIEELEDLLASYERIRNELTYDNSALRQENRHQRAKIKAMERQLEKQDNAPIYFGNR